MGRAGPVRRDRSHPAADAAPRRSAARAGDRRHHRYLAVHGQPGPDDLAGLLRRRDRLRVWRRDYQDPTEAVNAVTKSWAGLAGLLLLFLFIAQFVAYFNYSKMPEVAAAWLGDTLENSNVGGIWLLLAAMAITAVVNIIIPQAIAKWALLAPIFIPLFLRLGIGPATVLAAFRAAGSPGNLINPIMPYFTLIVVLASRYDRRSGIGTVIALMMPFFIAMTIVWALFFIAWYVIGIPFGIGT